MKIFKKLAILIALFATIRFGYSATQTINTLPSANATFIATIQTFLSNELANYAHLRFNDEISSGGIGTTSANLTHTITEVVGFPNGFYTNQEATSHTYTASKRTFVYLRDSDARTIIISGAAITYDSYLVFAEMLSASDRPANPTGTLSLMTVDTDGTSITTVTDIRDFNANITVVDTIADLRNLPVVDGKSVQVLDYSTLGDGGGGPVRVGVTGAAPGTYVDNGGSIIENGDGSEAWLLSNTSEYNVGWFGAVGNGTTDDTAAIRNAFLAASGSHGVVFPQKEFLVSDLEVSPTAGVPTRIDFGGATFTAAAGSSVMLTIKSPHTVSPNFDAKNLYLDGSSIATTGLYVYGMRRNTIRDMLIVRCTGDAYSIEGSDIGGGVYYNNFINLHAGLQVGVGNGGHGFKIFSTGGQNRNNGNNFIGCNAQWGIGDGFYIEYANGNTLTGCNAEANDGYGFNLIQTSGTVISGGYSEHNHEGYASGVGVGDGSADESFNFTADANRTTVVGGRHIGAVIGDLTGRQNKFLDNLNVSQTGGISFGSATPPASGWSFGGTDDFKFQMAGNNKLRWITTEDSWRFDIAPALTQSTLPELTANTDNYNPDVKTGWWRIRSSGEIDLTGIAGGTAGRRLLLTNVGSFAITLKHQTTSTTGNRILCNTGADIVLATTQSIDLVYDSGSTRWRTL